MTSSLHPGDDLVIELSAYTGAVQAAAEAVHDFLVALTKHTNRREGGRLLARHRHRRHR